MHPPALPRMPRAPPPSSVPPPGSFRADPGRKPTAVREEKRAVGDSGEACAGAPEIPGRRRMAGGYYLTDQSSAQVLER